MSGAKRIWRFGTWEMVRATLVVLNEFGLVRFQEMLSSFFLNPSYFGKVLSLGRALV